MITNKLKLDLQQYHAAPIIDAVQGDAYSRILEFSLHNGEKPFRIPQNPDVLIRYKKPDGCGGEYDTLPDGSPAWSAEGNRLTVTLIPQMLTFPGEVRVSITLIAEGAQISTFPLQIHVFPRIQASTADMEDYFNIAGFLIAPSSAKTGQYLKVSRVSESGHVTAIEAADAPVGSGSGAPADWDASEGEPGYVRNRTHWAEIKWGTVLEETSLTVTNGSQAVLTQTLPVSDGLEYEVRYNGTTYSCTALFVEEGNIKGYLLGNQAPIGGENTGEPFTVLAATAEMAAALGIGVIILPLDGSSAFSIAISGQIETVQPLDRKYLPKLRMQKTIQLNMDEYTASVPLSAVTDLDTGELQSAITVIYEGVDHSAVITSRETVEFDGENYPIINFQFVHYSIGILPKILNCAWQFDKLEIKSENVSALPWAGSSSEIMLYSKKPADTIPQWAGISNLPFSGITLKSSTPGSFKTFRLTVDDSGTLSITQQ